MFQEKNTTFAVYKHKHIPNTMKKIFTLAAIALVMCACNNSSSDNRANKCVKPLPAGYSADSLTDCTIPAVFTTDDFDWTARTLQLKVYSKDLYDTVDIQQLTQGDTLVFQGRTIIVNQVDKTDDGYITVNGGIEQDGADLVPYEGGTYRGIQPDDHAVYSLLGTAKLPLASDLVMTDCGTEPDDPIDTIRGNVKDYILKLNIKDNFNELNTQVLIEGGKITQINRHWIP